MRQHVLDCIPGGVAVTAVLTVAGAVARVVENSGHGQRQWDGVAFGKSVATQMGKGGRAGPGCFGHGFLTLLLSEKTDDAIRGSDARQAASAWASPL
ncbi:hypothetical protein X756_05315 [Mesorhizobium sp. LSHC412B00]|nr:hypothetical protein X756_05315 [Mesorhizobium sp. LSHC412B00]